MMSVPDFTAAFRRLAPRDRRALLLGLAVLLPALLYVAAVRPYRAALEDVRQHAAVERALLERELQIVADSDALPRLAHNAAERSTRANMRLVRAANVPLAEAEVTNHLQTVATMSRVLLQELRSVDAARGRTAEPPAHGLREIRLALRGESDLEGVLTFLQRIENSPLLLRIAELSLEPVYEGGGRSGERRATGVMQLAVVLAAFAPAEIDADPTARGSDE